MGEIILLIDTGNPANRLDISVLSILSNSKSMCFRYALYLMHANEQHPLE